MSNAQFPLYVQLQEYYNFYNLKYIPEKSVTPYCCCANKNICFSSTDASNLTMEICIGQCKLRFTLCAELTNITMETEEGMSDTLHCYMSEIGNSPPGIEFGSPFSGSHFFPNQMLPPLFSFPFENHSPTVSRYTVLFVL